MKIATSRGFTIIELLVVVAIIAVLTGIVLVNVVFYINSGKDASIKGNLSTALTNGAVFYEIDNTYTGFCADAKYANPSAAIDAIGGIVQSCNVEATGTAWCACASLKTNSADVFCVDYTGAKKTAAATDCNTECDVTSGVCL